MGLLTVADRLDSQYIIIQMESVSASIYFYKRYIFKEYSHSVGFHTFRLGELLVFYRNSEGGICYVENSTGYKINIQKSIVLKYNAICNHLKQS